MRARRRAVQLGRIEALARHERLLQHLRAAHPVEPVRARLVALDVPGVHVPVAEGGARSSTARPCAITTSCSSGFRYSISTSLCSSIACVSLSTRSSSSPTCGAGVCVRSNCAEGLLELRAHALERRVRAGRDHRADELEREPDRARLERRQAGRAAEGVAEELLVDVHLVAVQLGVDRVAAAAEVDEVEQREVLLERLARDREAVDELLRRDHALALLAARRSGGRRAATAARRSAPGRPGRRSARPRRRSRPRRPLRPEWAGRPRARCERRVRPR